MKKINRGRKWSNFLAASYLYLSKSVLFLEINLVWAEDFLFDERGPELLVNKIG